MCHERERLLDYAYDECEVDERRRIESHLAGCDECRLEIAELKQVRRDLQEWDAPLQPSLGASFAPVRQEIWWRQVPAWALGAAASVALMLGAVGGVAVQAFLHIGDGAASAAVVPAAGAQAAAEPAPAAAAEVVPVALAEVPAELIREQIAAAEDRIRREVWAEFEARLQAERQTRVQATTTAEAETGPTREEMLAFYKAWNNDLAYLTREVVEIQNQQNGLFRRQDGLTQVSLPGR